MKVFPPAARKDHGHERKFRLPQFRGAMCVRSARRRLLEKYGDLWTFGKWTLSAIGTIGPTTDRNGGCAILCTGLGPSGRTGVLVAVCARIRQT